MSNRKRVLRGDEDLEYLEQLSHDDLSENSSMDSFDESASSSLSSSSSEEDVPENLSVNEEGESAEFLENAQLNVGNVGAENLFDTSFDFDSTENYSNALVGRPTANAAFLELADLPIPSSSITSLVRSSAYNLSDDPMIAATVGDGFNDTSGENEFTSAFGHALAPPNPGNDTAPTSPNESDHNPANVSIRGNVRCRGRRPTRGNSSVCGGISVRGNVRRRVPGNVNSQVPVSIPTAANIPATTLDDWDFNNNAKPKRFKF
jgi:hypothetical protein